MRKDMTIALKWTAAVIIAFGVICSALNMNEFNDGNLGLMIGIGFLVGGLQILLFGVAAPLMMKKSDLEPEGLDQVEDLA
ncbi:hypothetical protein [Cohnella sp. JJ-181]|uniref:hypothetical protein n=1 Tax=Cohnella rhizoplanae TaxID=2974897 RepID=UPI0022FF74DD|nr:hypothetical protein [Cohnella sp. JJ-181]CAI6081737.1 hypothetical protein COHCIP112018_03410 [Cohnella sp. JJ-181]